MKFNINNPKFVKMFNATCMRAWYHKRKRIKKRIMLAHTEILKFGWALKIEKLILFARKKLTGWRETEWYLVRGY